jgi:hypothetical protein
MLLAYTASNEKGEKNVQTKIKPGRYLTMFFKDVLSEKEIAWFAARHANPTLVESRWSDYPLKFAHTPEDIAHVYQRGPTSCMDVRNFHNADKNPTRVYGAGDLAIAYLEGAPPPRKRTTDLTIVARALVWPEKKIAGRVYPTPDYYEHDGFSSALESQECQQTLVDKLRTAGYAFGAEGKVTFDGAKLLRIPQDRAGSRKLTKGFVVPFLDHRYKVIDNGTFLEMRRREGYAGQTQTGWLELKHPYTCEHCQTDMSADDRTTVRTAWHAQYQEWLRACWCAACATKDAYTCAGVGELFANAVRSVEHDGKRYTKRYHDANFPKRDAPAPAPAAPPQFHARVSTLHAGYFTQANPVIMTAIEPAPIARARQRAR